MADGTPEGGEPKDALAQLLCGVRDDPWGLDSRTTMSNDLDRRPLRSGLDLYLEEQQGTPSSLTSNLETLEEWVSRPPPTDIDLLQEWVTSRSPTEPIAPTAQTQTRPPQQEDHGAPLSMDLGAYQYGHSRGQGRAQRPVPDTRGRGRMTVARVQPDYRPDPPFRFSRSLNRLTTPVTRRPTQLYPRSRGYRTWEGWAMPDGTLVMDDEHVRQMCPFCCRQGGTPICSYCKRDSRGWEDMPGFYY